MKRYQVEIDYSKSDNAYSFTLNEDYIVKEVSFEEVSWHMRKALDEYVEEGVIDKAKAYDMVGDIPMFNEFMEIFHYDD